MAYEPPQGGTEDDSSGESGLSGDRYSSPPGGPGTGNAGNVMKADPGDYSTLPRSYLRVLTQARPETYIAEMPNAGWGKTLLGVALVTVITFGMKILLAPLTQQNMDNLKAQLASQGQYADAEPWKNIFPVIDALNSPLFALIVPITFFAGAALLYLVARASRGKEAENSDSASFMTHAYLLSLSYTPLRSISVLIGILALVPVVGFLGSLISIGTFLFQLYSAGLSMQASQKLAPNKSQMVAFLPWVVGVVLAICVTTVTLVTVLAPLLKRG